MNARELSNRLADLLRNERNALAEFVLALAHFDSERRWVELGHASLFAFLHRHLVLSKGAAFYRMTAAQLVQRHPEIIEPLCDGRLCLTNVVELAKVLTAENLAGVLPRFFHLSKREAKEVSAELKPTPAPARTVVTSLGSRHLALATQTVPMQPTTQLTQVSWPDEPVHANSECPTQEMSARLDSPAPISISSTRIAATVVEPKTAELSRVHITVSRAFLRKLDTARDALSHSHPGASEQEILEAGLDLLLERSAKRKGLVKTPRSVPTQRAPPPSRSRYIPAHIRREVWKRDQGKCQWGMEDGTVCGSTYRVQLDHIEPFARGWTFDSGDALVCLCQGHNDIAARRAFGNSMMDRYTGQAHRDSSPPPAGG
jgi:hypothetical protein